MGTYASQMRKQQHKTAREVNLQIGDIVMAKLHVPLVGSYKLSKKFSGPHKVIVVDTGNKFKIQNMKTGEVTIRHCNDLKKAAIIGKDLICIRESDEQNQASGSLENMDINRENIAESEHAYNNEYRKKLRSYKEVHTIKDMTDKVTKICCINEQELEKEFYDYVNQILAELRVDCNTFYR